MSNFDIHKLIDYCMNKKNCYVSIFFGEIGTTVNIYPYPEEFEDGAEDAENESIVYTCSQCDNLTINGPCIDNPHDYHYFCSKYGNIPYPNAFKCVDFTPIAPKEG